MNQVPSISAMSQPKSLRDCLDPQKPLLPALRNTYLAATSAFLYVVVMGMVTSYSAPATVDMQRPGSRFFGGLTPDEVTWIASLPLFGGIVGNILGGYLIQKLGRKAVLMCVSASYTTSWLIIAYSTTVPSLYAGRALSGLCAGITCVAAPAYVAEIAPAAHRGRLSSGFQLAFATGVLLAMGLGAALRWSWLAVFGACMVVVSVMALLPFPESPPWLLRHDKTQEALRAVRFLRGEGVDLDKEVQSIQANIPQGDEGIDLRDPAFYKPVLISVALMFFQQFSGINSLMSYTVEIFESSGGGSAIPPEPSAVVVAAVQLLATAVSTTLVDRSGRRKLFILSSASMTVFLATLGLYAYKPNSTFAWVPLFSFVGYIASYSLGVGPIPFVMTPELVNIRARGAILAVASVSCSLFGFVVTKVYEDMKQGMGMYGVYWTYGFFTLSSAIFGYFFLPETKGMSIKQIHRSFSVPSE